MQFPVVCCCLTLLLVCNQQQTVRSAKILAMFTLPAHSHTFFARVLTRELARRGHQVTEVSSLPDSQPVPNRTVLFLEGVEKSARQLIDYESYARKHVFSSIIKLTHFAELVCETAFQSQVAKFLIDSNISEKFDLVITEACLNECFYGFIHKLGYPPIVAISSHGVPPWTSTFMGTPENPSYVPHYTLPYTDHMTFIQRLFNFVTYNFLNYIYEYNVVPIQERVARKYLGKKFPSYHDIERNFSIFLANTAFSLDYPRPLSPNVILIGGMHINHPHPKKLPQDLHKFMYEAKDGCIFVSMGTVVESQEMTNENLKVLLDTFSELPQRVLWKFEEDSLPNLPSNVVIRKWFPQSDILGHPNMRLFISHCGRLSVMESVYKGIPVVGMPLLFDQISNIKILETKGVGVYVNYRRLTKESLLAAVKEVLYNRSYRDNMNKLSAMFREEADKALDRAVYWTEFVIRHRGAQHLRATTGLLWHQHFLLDVLLFLATGTLLLVYLIQNRLQTVVRQRN